MIRNELTAITSELYKSKKDMELWEDIWKALKAGPQHPKCKVEISEELGKRIEEYQKLK